MPRYRSYQREGWTGFWLCMLAILAIPVVFVLPYYVAGIGGFGPVETVTATVDRLYVDAGGDAGSHYMVGTNRGVFEVDNGFVLNVWNADELYSRIHEGGTYRFKTRGNRVVNFLFQEYPYIVAVEPVEVESR